LALPWSARAVVENGSAGAGARGTRRFTDSAGFVSACFADVIGVTPAALPGLVEPDELEY